jgi:transcriptional regulator
MAGETGKVAIVSAERKVKALELRKAGVSYRAIGDNLGVSKQAAHAMVKGVLEELGSELAETGKQVLHLELARLDEMTFKIWPDVRRGDHEAIKIALRICERRSRLLGLEEVAQNTLNVDLSEFTITINDTIAERGREIGPAVS